MTEHLTGAQLGSYQVRELLGSGGMAKVYKGYDTALDREVAIKVISTAGQQEDFVRRLQREARTIARLRHPNIVQIHHFGVERDVVYMVQELLPGPTLAQRISEGKRRPMAASRIHGIILQLAGALDFAHTQGIIHRDVKPSNVLYNADGQLVLVDFGIAKPADDVNRTGNTGPGIVMGTPAYVAPEQAISSAALTKSCDIYSLGVILFELLTGRPPFQADTPMGVILKHLYDEPPKPSSLRPGMPPQLDMVVLRSLHKDPAERHPSALALVRAIETTWPAIRTQSAEPAVPVGRGAAKPAVAAVVEKTPQRRNNTPTPTNGTRTKSATTTPRPSSTTPRPVSKTSTPTSSQARPNSKRPNTAALANSIVTPAAQRSSMRVGLLTAIVVSGLILFGLRPNSLAEAWQTALQLVRLWNGS